MLDLINNLRISRKFTWLLSYFVVTEILAKHLRVGTEKNHEPIRLSGVRTLCYIWCSSVSRKKYFCWSCPWMRYTGRRR